MTMIVEEVEKMRSIFLTLALVFSCTVFCQDTNVNVTLNGVKDSFWMFGLITPNIHGGYTYQAADFTDEGLIRSGKILEFDITEPGGYCVTMNSSRFEKTSVIHIIVEEGSNYKIVEKVRGKNLHL